MHVHADQHAIRELSSINSTYENVHMEVLSKKTLGLAVVILVAYNKLLWVHVRPAAVNKNETTNSRVPMGALNGGFLTHSRI